MRTDDEAMIARAVAGDGEAVRSLLLRVGPQVHQEIAAQIGRAWQALVDADDVMQVSYVEAFLQIESLHGRDLPSFASWLRRIAVNNLRDAIKELERKKRPDPSKRVDFAASNEDSCVALIELLGAESATPSRHAAARESVGLIEAALAKLPPDYARVVRMYDLEGLEMTEVARGIGRSPGAAHMLRARAHDRLRALLGTPRDFFSEA